MIEQLAAIKVNNRANPHTKHCFRCGKPDHIASNCCSRSEPTCYNCGKRRHVFQDCWSQGNGQGVSQIFELGAHPGTDQCSTCGTCSYTCTQQLYSLYTWTAKQQLCDLLAGLWSILFSSQQEPLSATQHQTCCWHQLGNANRRNIIPCGTTTLTVTLGSFSTAILGSDFLREHGFVFNFYLEPITVRKVPTKHYLYM